MTMNQPGARVVCFECDGHITILRQVYNITARRVDFTWERLARIEGFVCCNVHDSKVVTVQMDLVYISELC